MIIALSSAQLILLLQMLTPSVTEATISTLKQASITLIQDIIPPNGEDLFPPMIQLSLIPKM